MIYQFDGGASSIFRADVWNMALTAATDVYFIVVVAVRARSATTRVAAALLGLLASILDLATLALVYYTDYTVVVQWISNLGGAVALVLFVAAWGVARRRRRTWYIGLVPTFLIAVAISLSYQLKWAADLLGDMLLSWFVSWALWIGALVLGCLICWAFDARSPVRSSPPQPVACPPYPPPPGPGDPIGPERDAAGRDQTQ